MVKLLLKSDCDPGNLDELFDWMLTHGIMSEEDLLQDEEVQKWYRDQKRNPRTLKHITRTVIHHLLNIGPRDTPRVVLEKAELPLPKIMIEFLCIKSF